MFYDSELHFLQSVLKKCRVQIQTINVNEYPESNHDLGLRTLLEIDAAFEKPLIELLGEVLPNTIHLLMDGYMCKYIYLQLPGDISENVLVIGPYQVKSFNDEEILELAEKIMFHLLKCAILQVIIMVYQLLVMKVSLFL